MERDSARRRSNSCTAKHSSAGGGSRTVTPGDSACLAPSLPSRGRRSIPAPLLRRAGRGGSHRRSAKSQQPGTMSWEQHDSGMAPTSREHCRRASAAWRAPCGPPWLQTLTCRCIRPGIQSGQLLPEGVCRRIPGQWVSHVTVGEVGVGGPHLIDGRDEPASALGRAPASTLMRWQPSGPRLDHPAGHVLPQAGSRDRFQAHRASGQPAAGLRQACDILRFARGWRGSEGASTRHRSFHELLL